MKRTKRHYLNFLLFCLVSLISISVLFYAPPSHEATPNDAQINYLPPIDPATNVMCKRIVIDPTHTARDIRPGVRGGTTPACEKEFVAVGIDNGALNRGNAMTDDWLLDSNPDSWGISISFAQGMIPYNKGRSALNEVSLVCVPREIVLKEGPCTQ